MKLVKIFWESYWEKQHMLSFKWERFQTKSKKVYVNVSSQWFIESDAVCNH